ncbi:VRR-NUC domain-containing protein [Methylobacterium sp. WL19]|uniref:VRR-NUC domain-containing protein n=1 Tax=Methylobacterium sp. WL19 TaxID=2603896 RepID=UPI0011CC557A|nr:VRR-NUC domain-containing protein [Methylobacterium sp. WL19]TXN33926.1 VRR-NUC domain-containing protein [Methylobacterium sp. WL19]
MTPRPPSEECIQGEIVVAMSRTFDARTVHVANGGKRSAKEGAKLRSMGVWAGHPDLIVYGDDDRSFLIEVKDQILAREREVPTDQRFDTLDPKQKDAVLELRARGKTVHVIDNVEDALAAGRAFGLAPKTIPIRASA